ncbi:hypothetical protein D9M71_367620 [compost metagenome]
MLRRNEPSQQLWRQRRTFASLRERPLQGQEAIVQNRQRQGAVQGRDTTIERCRPGIAIGAPDLIEHHMAFIARLPCTGLG